MDVVSNENVESVEAENGVFPAQLATGNRMNVQHFRFEPGASASEHSHPNEQVAFVYKGTLTLIVEGKEYNLSAGDSMIIPGDTPHSAENQGEEQTQGIDVFSPPREDTPWDS